METGFSRARVRHPPAALRWRAMRAEEAPTPGAAAADDQGVGARVNAVFTAAEKAAQHILTMAREEGDDIRRQARAEADTLVQEWRVEAEREAERILAEARGQGEAIKEEARAAARRIEDDARVRKDRLREETRLIEERVAWAHEGLREVAARLTEIAAADDEPPAA
jgi:F0F1-type ATP synthase membrane subunit b/b'